MLQMWGRPLHLCVFTQRAGVGDVAAPVPGVALRGEPGIREDVPPAEVCSNWAVPRAASSTGQSPRCQAFFAFGNRVPGTGRAPFCEEGVRSHLSDATAV